MEEWILIKDKLPSPSECFGKWYIVCDARGQVFPLRYAKRTIRGKNVERWQECDGRIYYGVEIYAWMPLPKPIKVEGE